MRIKGFCSASLCSCDIRRKDIPNIHVLFHNQFYFSATPNKILWYLHTFIMFIIVIPRQQCRYLSKKYCCCLSYSGNYYVHSYELNIFTFTFTFTFYLKQYLYQVTASTDLTACIEIVNFKPVTITTILLPPEGAWGQQR